MRSDRIREFEIFLAVVELGSYSAAGRKFELTPSAISKLVDRLEARLGVRLLQRNSRALSLTHEGKAFQQAAERALEAIAEVENTLQDIGAAISGTLRVHVETLNFAEHLLAPVLPLFLRAHPSVRLEFLLRADYLDLTKEEYDLSLRRGPVSHPSLVAKPIATSRWLLCASPEYLQRAGVPVRPEDLAKHNCLNFLPQMQRSQWPLSTVGDRSHVNVDPIGNVASNSENLLRQLALQGLGIVCLTEFHVRADIGTGVLAPVLEGFVRAAPERIYAVFQSRRNLSPRVRAFLHFLEEHLAADKSSEAFGRGRDPDRAMRSSAAALNHP